MTYTTAYNYLLSLANMPRREYMADAKHCVIYIKRLNSLLNILGNPQKKIPKYVHVTGTSGKGSTSLMISSILKENKKKVGTITSPHPSTIVERWEINGKAISKKKFIQLIEMLKPKLDEYLTRSPYEMPSFFEIITAIGLYYFAEEKVDWAVIEVGLGGRYDSTNCIPNKDICVITNIGDDHKNIIGPTKKDIAYEKSGIIKKGCSVFTMEKNKDILNIIEKECQKVKSKKLIKLNSANGKITNQNIDGISFGYKEKKYNLGVLGKHQVNNALIAIEVAQSIGVSYETIQKGLIKVELPLRMEILKGKPTIILDGAHNIDKIKSTINTITDISGLKDKNLHIVLGFSFDKEWPKMLNQLIQLKPKSIACTRYINNIFRTVADPREIYKIVKKKNSKIKTKIFLDSTDAFNWSQKQAKSNDIILVTGSIFLGGEIRLLLKK